MSFILNSGRFGAAADPGLTLLQSATLWLDASDPGSDSQKAQNKGTGGTALDARLGSTTSVDTNDPLLLMHTGTNYLYLPGIAGNNCTVPSSSALNVTGSIDIRIRVALTDWTPSTNHTLVSKRNNSGTDFTYELRVNSSGTLLFAWGGDAVTYNEETSSAAPTVSDGQAIWLRVTRDTSTGDVIFYQAADSSTMPSSWTQIGTTQASTPSAIYGSANNLNIGAFYHTTPNFGSCDGKFYRVVIYNGIGGTIVFDADFTANTNQSSFTESSSNAATVTINRTTSGRKAVMVTRPVWLFGTDDYMEIADNALLDMGATDPFSVLVVGRAWSTQGTNDTLVAKKADVTNTTAGYLLANHGTTALQLQADIGDGTNGIEATSASRTAGDRKVWAMVRSVASDNLTTYINTTAGTPVTDTTTATLANAEVLRIGRLSGAGTEYADVEIDTVVLVKGTAYDSTQIGQIMTYLGVS